MSHNHIKHISYSLPRALIEIDLSYNGLVHIKLDSDMSLNMCEILNVSHNKLKSLNFLKVCHTLYLQINRDLPIYFYIFIFALF